MSNIGAYRSFLVTILPIIFHCIGVDSLLYNHIFVKMGVNCFEYNSPTALTDYSQHLITFPKILHIFYGNSVVRKEGVIVLTRLYIP